MEGELDGDLLGSTEGSDELGSTDGVVDPLGVIVNVVGS